MSAVVTTAAPETLAELLASGSDRLLALAGPESRARETATTDAAARLRGQLAEASSKMLTPVTPLAEPTGQDDDALDADTLNALIDAILEAAVVELRAPEGLIERISPKAAQDAFADAFTDARRTAIAAGRAVAVERLRGLAARSGGRR